MQIERDESQLTVPELLSGYARSLAELRRRGVVRSANAPAGDYVEWLVATVVGGELAQNLLGEVVGRGSTDGRGSR